MLGIYTNTHFYQGLDDTRVSNYPDPILTYKQSVTSMIWLSWVFMFLLFYMQKSQVLKLLKSEYRDLSGGTQEGVEVLTAYAIQGYFSLFYHANIQH